MNTATWQAIRALRAAPTGAAASNLDRRRTFAASLRQAEELADAAQAAGYAARPLPLFYSLSQAGRAIAAAHLPAPGVVRGHGLNVIVDSTKPLLETSVKPSKPGNDVDSFRGAAQAIGSPVLLGRANLGELWAANPDLQEIPIPSKVGSWPKALEVPIGVQYLGGMLSESQSDPEQVSLTTDGFVAVSLDLPGKTGHEIEDALKPYPTLRGAFGLKQGTAGAERAGPNDIVSRGPDHSGVLRASVAVEAPKQTNMADFWRRQRGLASIVQVDESQPEYPAPHLIGYALPEVAGGPCPFPLMLWWALLLGLSSLARYEPAVWTSAIDLDKSDLAVSLERVLDVATERIPARILQCLQ